MRVSALSLALVGFSLASCGTDDGGGADTGELPPLSADPMTGSFGGRSFTPVSSFIWGAPVAGAPDVTEYTLLLLGAANASCPASYAARGELQSGGLLVSVTGIIPDAEARSDDTLKVFFKWPESSVDFERGRITFTAESASAISGKLVAKPFSGDEYVNGAFNAKLCPQ